MIGVSHVSYGGATKHLSTLPKSLVKCICMTRVMSRYGFREEPWKRLI